MPSSLHCTALLSTSKMFLSRLRLVSRSVAPQRVVATARARAANILPRISTSTLLTSRSFCADVHDDFKPKRRAYSPDENVHAQIAKDIAENKVCKLDRVVQILRAENVEFKGFNVLADPVLHAFDGLAPFQSIVRSLA
eukprot:1805429-Pleurochrysis_carterae.AAC.4